MLSTIIIFCSILLRTTTFGEFFDMSEGDPGMVTPCPPGQGERPGIWTEEAASLYQTNESGPLDGMVLTSEKGVKSCLRTPNLFTVNRTSMFKLYVYMPDATEIAPNKRKLQVWIVEQNEQSYTIMDAKGPSEAGWFTLESSMPSVPGITYPKLFNVSFCKF
jgi:hypothetical protein